MYKVAFCQLLLFIILQHFKGTKCAVSFVNLKNAIIIMICKLNQIPKLC